MQNSDVQKVYLNPNLLRRAQAACGLSDKKLASVAEVNYRTLLVVYQEKGVLPATALSLANAVGRGVLDLLAPWDARYEPPADPHGPFSGSTEWECASHLDAGRQVPNGLYFIVCRMKHRHTPGRIGRGKFYHLSWLATKTKEEMRHKLSRHAETCVRGGAHPHVALNLVSTPTTNGEGWWVIDEWTGEKTLADHLEQGPWPRESLPRLLHEIALGLDALHQAGVILRELAPSRVLIADKDGRAVLTDFELAKLLDGSPSVSSEWPEDSFRAPEVDGGHVTERADLYSFGCLTAAAVAGRTPSAGEAKAILSDAGFPKRLGNLLLKCAEPIPDRRPEGLTPLLKELERWAKG